MRKNTVIVTGASGSIGKAITIALVQQGYPVIMACRNIEKAEKTKQEILIKNKSGLAEVLPLDLSSQKSIRHFGKLITSRKESIGCLINNAGIMCKDYCRTAEGIEMTMGVNFIGTALLTEILIPMMLPGSRILFTSSITRKTGTIDNNMLNPQIEKYRRFKSYGSSKLAITIYASELSERLAGKINVNVVSKARRLGISLWRWLTACVTSFGSFEFTECPSFLSPMPMTSRLSLSRMTRPLYSSFHKSFHERGVSLMYFVL